jgi:16S rRNA (cytidine1402-2'-O)-methyltransferase
LQESVPGPRSPVPREGGGGILYVVATPIGNLGDLSPRAREVLAAVALVLAEDTRRVRQLLTHFGLRTPTRSLHEHNEERELPALLTRLAAGQSLALVSDAGTPVIADPGFRLVRACRERGVPVLAVPGPSAVTAAVAVAGLPPQPFTFVGFLPARAGPRATLLAELATVGHTLVLFLTPHRLAAELAACRDVLGGEREAVLLAELSKLHERCQRGALGSLAAWASGATPRGEYTLVVGPPPAAAPRAADARAAQAALEAELARAQPLAEARRAAARRLGVSRRQLYELLARDRR